MYLDRVLEEARQLHKVSDRLTLLAEQNPLISQELIVISGTTRNTATLLEVLVATKVAGQNPAHD